MKYLELFEKLHDIFKGFIVGSYYFIFGYFIFLLGYIFSKKIWGIKESVYGLEKPKLDRTNWFYYSGLRNSYKEICKNSKYITFLPFLIIVLFLLIKFILF